MRRITALLLVIAAVAFLLSRFSYSHPFLLSDNRHYTFYVCQRFFCRDEWGRLALAPLYVALASFLWRRLATSPLAGPVWTAVWLTAVAITIIPAELVEPRYFSVGIVLALMHMRLPNATKLALALLTLLVNAATLAVFVWAPFEDAHGVLQRFMW
jgi:alpha-1,2-glucosyltransferase